MLSKLYSVLYNEIFSYLSLNELIKYREISKKVKNINQVLFINILDKATAVIGLSSADKTNIWSDDWINEEDLPYEYGIEDEKVYVDIHLKYLNYINKNYIISGYFLHYHDHEIECCNLVIQYVNRSTEYKKIKYEADNITKKINKVIIYEMRPYMIAIKKINNKLDALPEKYRICYDKWKNIKTIN